MATETISLMDAEAYDAFVLSLIDGDGAFHLRPSYIEVLPGSGAINFMEGEVGADDAGAIIEVDEGSVKSVGYYPAERRIFLTFE